MAPKRRFPSSSGSQTRSSSRLEAVSPKRSCRRDSKETEIHGNKSRSLLNVSSISLQGCRLGAKAKSAGVSKRNVTAAKIKLLPKVEGEELRPESTIESFDEAECNLMAASASPTSSGIVTFNMRESNIEPQPDQEVDDLQSECNDDYCTVNVDENDMEDETDDVEEFEKIRNDLRREMPKLSDTVKVGITYVLKAVKDQSFKKDKRINQLKRLCRAKNVIIDNLRSELELKDEQLARLNDIASKNLELEAKLSLLEKKRKANEASSNAAAAAAAAGSNKTRAKSVFVVKKSAAVPSPESAAPQLSTDFRLPSLPNVDLHVPRMPKVASSAGLHNAIKFPVKDLPGGKQATNVYPRKTTLYKPTSAALVIRKGTNVNSATSSGAAPSHAVPCSQSTATTKSDPAAGGEGELGGGVPKSKAEVAVASKIAPKGGQVMLVKSSNIKGFPRISLRHVSPAKKPIVISKSNSTKSEKLDNNQSAKNMQGKEPKKDSAKGIADINGVLHIDEDSDIEEIPSKNSSPCQREKRARKDESSDESDEDSSIIEVGVASKMSGNNVQDEQTQKSAATPKKISRLSADKEESDGKGRKHIRKVMSDEKLKETTITAYKEEVERTSYLEQLQKRHLIVQERKGTEVATSRLVLELKKPSSTEAVVEVLPFIVRKLKAHQVEAVEFLWNNLVECTEKLAGNYAGSGCILAHCMGLGKTLSVISLLHTLMTNPRTKKKFSSCLIVCPLNTVLNWVNELNKWIPKKERLQVFEITTCKTDSERCDSLETWMADGGIMIMGYTLFRMLLNNFHKSKKKRDTCDKTLRDPGPDLVVCDEGHILKNDATQISKMLNTVRTRRRIILTGTPLQNNLIEYHCMVSFVKPSLLGTRREFCNRFVNPITNGQHADSTAFDVGLMKKRAHILHTMLSGCVLRKDYTALLPYLPPKHEYVVSIRLSSAQVDLYNKYLDICRSHLGSISTTGAGLFVDFNTLMQIWTHPWLLKLAQKKQEKKLSAPEVDTDGEAAEEMSDEDELGAGASDEDGAAAKKPGKHQSLKERSVTAEPAMEEMWWTGMVSDGMESQLELSGKLVVLLEILRMAEGLGDKVLVFSQSLLSLDLIESTLERRHVEAKRRNKGKAGGGGRWERDVDYIRMDGSTGALNRKKLTSLFNDIKNVRLRLFLISTRAGGLGINLDCANRVVIFDANWNPSHDVQSIFRVFRFGQVKPVFIYRLLAQGTMEEKIYERQVTKETIAQRVIDENQIDRHFTASDLAELYTFTPDLLESPRKRPTPKVPEDIILAELLTEKRRWIVEYHEHDSLLESRPEEDLSEEERKAAWEEYERDRNMPMFNQHNRMYMPHSMGQPNVAVSRSVHLPSSSSSSSGGDKQHLRGRPTAAQQAKARNLSSTPTSTSHPLIQASGNKKEIQLEMSQVPRVVREILKYNPNITATELQNRLQAFMGMHAKKIIRDMGLSNQSNIIFDMQNIQNLIDSNVEIKHSESSNSLEGTMLTVSGSRSAVLDQ